jgi:hypothetical protein
MEFFNFIGEMVKSPRSPVFMHTNNSLYIEEVSDVEKEVSNVEKEVSNVEEGVSNESDFLSEDDDSSTQKYEAKTKKVLKEDDVVSFDYEDETTESSQEEEDSDYVYKDETTESSQEEDSDDSDVNISKTKRKRYNYISKRMDHSFFGIETKDGVTKCNPRQGNSFPVIRSSDGLGGYYCRRCLSSKGGRKEVLLSKSRKKALKDKENIFACKECGTHYVKYELNGTLMFRTKCSKYLINSMGYPSCKHCGSRTLVCSFGKYPGDKKKNIKIEECRNSYMCTACNKRFIGASSNKKCNEGKI